MQITRNSVETAWTSDELDKVGAAEELQIAPRRRDGTLRNALPVWVIRHGDDLYVRSVNGRTAAWFRAAHASHEGHVRAGGVERDVAFVEVDGGLDDQIDAAYWAKYGRRYPSIVPSIVKPEARAATLRLVPR
jgi:hypothetical protein